jgi:[protein-PII] uridylyltransferase
VSPSAQLTAARRRIVSADSLLAQRFWAGEDIDAIVRGRAKFFDELIRDLWARITWPDGAAQHVALFAVGGYGRGELHPHSDIDLLILVDGDPAEYRDGIEQFVQNLWDLKLNIGHSVRTVDQCHQEAKDDIATATAILERRLLTGTLVLDRQVGRLFATDEIWPSARFFSAKVDEQRKRHDRYQDVDYNLEPNIKVAPGGLRDIQTVGWIIKRHFGNTSHDDLTARGFLTAQEGQWLHEGRRFLWRVRYGLHLIVGRAEDRLLFDYQRTLADRLGYQDTDAQLGVEQFMHDYYGHVLSLREVNDILLQHFDEAILRAHYEPEIEPINERFQIRDNYIETRSSDVFQQQPSALMELFVIMANRRDISGVRATTIRQVRNHLDLIDDEFRNDPKVTGLFIDLLRAPYTLVSQLTRMRRYGVLGRYIPEFGEIIGQMQHDLFHIYTVDAHTMMVIRNMRRLHYRSSQEKFPVAYHCVKNLPKIELLYIAGLYHDIAKGRGGDHSTLGAHDVIAFCRRHCLAEEDTDLVAWLVRVHLLMSATAQSKDINDPVVIHEFASEVRSELRLDYLYALTVADINATNPTLWNGWRATLMRQLYMETRKALRRGLSLPVDRAAHIEHNKSEALARLAERGIERTRALALWDDPDPEFFLQHSVGHVVSLTEAIAKHDLSTGPLVLVRDVLGHVSDEGATEIFLYTRDQPRLFAASVIAIDQLGLSIHDARIHTSKGNLCFNSYIVLDESGRSISADTARCRHIERTLIGQLSNVDHYPELAKRRIPRRLKQFQRPTQAFLTNDTESPWSVLRVVASDRPGLLARLGLIFVELGINVHSAKITTLGERVEDLFYISGRDSTPIRDPERIEIVTRAIRERLDQQLNEESLATGSR